MKRLFQFLPLKIKKTIGPNFSIQSFQSSLVVSNSNEMENLGKKMANQSKKGDIFLLSGTLGCGKTCFARGFIREMLKNENLIVTSPTYLLINEYPLEDVDRNQDKLIIYHMDMYRLHHDKLSKNDISALGLFQAFSNGICLIEWPDRIMNYLPKKYIDIQIKHDDKKDSYRYVNIFNIDKDKDKDTNETKSYNII